MQKFPFKPIALATFISLSVAACGSSGGGSGVKSTTTTNNSSTQSSSNSTDTTFYATGDVRFNKDGSGLLVDARHKIVNATKSDQSIYKQVYETLIEQTGENAYHQSYTAYGLHNMGTESSQDYRVVFAAKDIPSTLPDSLDASYNGKAIFTDPEQENQFVNGTINMTIKNQQITGAFDFAQNGKLTITNAEIDTSNITEKKSGANFNIGGELTGSIKNIPLSDGGFYGFVAGKQYEEVVGAIFGNLEKDSTTIEAQGVFAGSKQ
ncbi:hypothetical protein ACFFHK_06010 [Gallibacterium trehalosifermentans]|uniref:Transferrin-binding protein B C-lobe/N-lobe beta barrel domain-containing protein n=1 Tax=Gallibacterium trehalosifermentans TaxID=516935 RepID=A0ABV6H1L6_9PAST